MAQQIKPPASNAAQPPPPPPPANPPPQSAPPPTPPPPPPATPPPTPPPTTPAPPQEDPGTSQYDPNQPSEAEVKRSPFRIIIPILVGLLILALLIFGVRYFLGKSGGEATPDAPVVINYWGLWEPTPVLNSIFAEFQSTNPNIKVNYQQQSHKDYRERLQNALAGDQGPDLFRYHHTWVPMLRSQLSQVPSDIYSSSEYDQTFYKVASKWLTDGRNLVGIPLMFEGLSLYYNQDIFEAAGLTPPKTWSELRRTAKQLTVTQDGQILRGGIALGTTSNVEHWPDIIGLMLLQNSADPAHPNNQLGQDALTFYTLFSQTDKVWDDTMPTSTFAFATEKAAMMIAPSWRAHDVSEINPDLNFATATAPQLPDTESDITWTSFWAEGVSSQSSKDQQAAAWKLIKFMSQKETLRKFYSSASDAPGRLFGEPFSRVDLADQLTSDPLVGAYIVQAPNSKSWYLASFTHDNGINDKIIKYYEDALNAILNNESAEDALEPVEEGIKQVFAQYGIK